MRTTFGLYRSYDNAKTAVNELMDKNFSKEEINIIAQRSAVESAWDVNEKTIDIDVTDQIGAYNYREKKVEGLDEFLGRKRPINTNAAGELYASGEVASAVARTLAAPGAADGSLKGAFKEFGVSDESAKTLEDGVRNGEFLIMIRTSDERSAEAKKLLIETKAANVNTIRG